MSTDVLDLDLPLGNLIVFVLLLLLHVVSHGNLFRSSIIAHPTATPCRLPSGSLLSVYLLDCSSPPLSFLAHRYSSFYRQPNTALILLHSKVSTEYCPEQWCPAIIIPRLHVSALLAQVLHHREVAHGVLPSAVVSCHHHSSPPCRPPAHTSTAPQASDPLVLQSSVMPTYRIFRLQFHLRSLHHCPHNIHMSLFTDFTKTFVMWQVFWLGTFTGGICQV